MILKYFVDTILEFDEPSYSIKLSYGINGKVFKFKTFKRTLNEKEKNEISKCNNYPKNDEYSFNGNYSLEYVPGIITLLKNIIIILCRLYFN